MIEIVRRVVGHPDFLHHASRLCVGDDREGDDLVEAEGRETMLERRQGRLGGVAMAPMLMGDAPADFDAWRERSLETRPGKAAHADAIGYTWRLYRPEPEPVLGLVRAHAVYAGLTLGPRHERREVFPDSGVGVE